LTVDSDILRREAEFHDALAAELDPLAMVPRALDHLEAALLQATGDVRGKRVLDLGCGTGDLTLELLRRGAHVTALDISPGMVDVARRRAEHHRPGLPVQFLAGDAEASGLPDAAFELVIGKWIIHHLDTARICREVSRLLVPGGRGWFIENQATNPLLRLARERVAGRFGVPMFGTADEHPLTETDYATMRATFRGVSLHYPDFYFARMFNRQVLRQRFHPTNVAARSLDNAIYARVPRLRRSSYHVIVALEG
jgi:ubiquinone/menaquinone biosynthesis C-methylase UbiE